jgi:hypothetical protein
MSAEAVGAPIRSPSPAAERMRQYRKRHRKGLRCVRIRLHVADIDVLVRKGYLEEKDRDDRKAVQMAVDAFVGDAFFDAR